ncbi:MAG: dihydrofolate reductase [Candidatus Omnitrophota bacterium]|jgi:dihydrofolate reductase
MKLYQIVAMAENRVIGRDNALPWHFSSDMKHFRETTRGSTVIMGRKTFDSIGKALPNRANFVITRDSQAHANKEFTDNSQSLRFFESIETALEAIDTPKAFIIGGQNLYDQTIHLVDGIYLTLIHQDYEGDAYFPAIPAHFKEKSRQTIQKDPSIDVIFYTNSQ